jgi:soluble lytic murein transglycosylase-like protein
VASVVSALAGGQASSYTYLTPMLSLFNGISEYLNSSSSDISTTSDTSASLSDDSLKNESSAAASGTSSNTGVTTSGTLESIFAKAAQTYGISENLLKAVAKAESNFDTNAVSSAGAQGIMQLMPATAKALGVTNAFDPEQNIMGGAKYLSQMLERYNGDTTLALAAYNAGPGNVKKYGGVPPFKSTQSYIKKVLSYAGEI